MDCVKHQKPMQQVCGEFKCGLCYEEGFKTERHVKPPQGPFPEHFTKREFTGFGPSSKAVDRMAEAVERMKE